MDSEILKAAHHLIWVWYQYGGGATSAEGRVQLEHRNMNAGEGASDFLEGLGLGSDFGYYFELNDAGMQLFNEDFD